MVDLYSFLDEQWKIVNKLCFREHKENEKNRNRDFFKEIMRELYTQLLLDVNKGKCNYLK